MTPKELKNIAPKLSEIQNLSHGFDCPEGYFNSFENDVLPKIILDSINKEHAFSIPNDYFNTLESSVFQKIESEDSSVPKDYFDTIEDDVFSKIEKNPKILTLKNESHIKKFTIIAIAASIVLIFTFPFFESKSSFQPDTISVLEIEQWITDGEMDLNTDLISSIYEDINIEEFDIYNQYEDEDTLNYLNDVNLESLILTN